MTQLFTNNADSALTAAIGAADTSCTVADGSRFAAPTGGDYQLVTINTGSTYEICRLTARTGNVLTITRAQESTTAQSWGIGARVFADVTAGAMDRSVAPDGLISVGTIPADSIPVHEHGVDIRTRRNTDTQVASGENSVAIGNNSTASAANAIALGSAAGALAADTVGLGRSASAEKAESTAIGRFAFADASGSIAIQNGSTFASYTLNAGVLPAATTLWWGWGNAESFRGNSVMESVVLSDAVDLTATGTITLPVLEGGVRFYTDEIGIIIYTADTVTVQPEISVGVTGDNAKLLAAVTTTGLDAVNKRQRFQTLLSHDGETEYTFTVVTAATATALTARVYFRGFAVQDEPA